MQNFNLNLQQELSRSAVVQIGYVGSNGHKLWDFRDINQPSQAEITAADLGCDCINDHLPAPLPDTHGIFSLLLHQLGGKRRELQLQLAADELARERLARIDLHPELHVVAFALTTPATAKTTCLMLRSPPTARIIGQPRQFQFRRAQSPDLEFHLRVPESQGQLAALDRRLGHERHRHRAVRPAFPHGLQFPKTTSTAAANSWPT